MNVNYFHTVKFYSKASSVSLNLSIAHVGSCHRHIKLLRQTRRFREKVLFCLQIYFEGPNKFSFFSLFLKNKKPLSLRKFCYKYTTQVSLWSVPKRLQLFPLINDLAGILGTKSVSLSFSLVDMIGNHVEPFYGSLTGKVDVILWVL